MIKNKGGTLYISVIFKMIKIMTHRQGVEVLTEQEFTIWETFSGRELI